ncbi:MAG: tetraacyldisaccharide 4'-kinase [Bacteroidia bacterium]|jgi:tetraacyldisaccharide 4'-kinase|nr:tetraacyldisaccharide 4'-kinase [Bacteroidia bacterium]
MVVILRIILSPLALLYGLAFFLRNQLYKLGILTRSKFDIPIICVGNLSAGGTGKTPHIEWLIQQLSSQYRIAVLSRGYKRKTTGYLFASEELSPKDIGDEPFQYAQKFKQVAVGVSENRVLGVPLLLADAPGTDVVLMDDGYQHLPLRAGLNIVLTDYNLLYTRDYLMPLGTLREFRSGARRAQCIIVSKCKSDLKENEAKEIRAELNLLDHQHLFFTTIKYLPLQPIYNQEAAPIKSTNQQIIAFSGIAKPDLFEQQLKRDFNLAKHIVFNDHQNYTLKEVNMIVGLHQAFPESIIVTTEKDSVKMNDPEIRQLLSNLPLYYLPIGVDFLFNQEQAFKQVLKDFIDPTLAAYRAE